MPSGSGESHLLRAAAAGDGPAFACLYEAYERRIFNYLVRLLGDRHEAEDATQDAFLRVMAKLPDLDQEELRFGPYLYTAARNAGYDVIAKRRKVEPSGAVPEEAADPFRNEPADLETDPERSVLAGSQERAVRAANERLPERQREALALRELDDMSYDEIGSVMEMKSNAVAQLISRARIGLRKEMRVGAAASVALASPDCEKAHGVLACRQDGQAGTEDSWLDEHLAACPNCRVAGEEMAEAGVSYRAWAPVVPAAWLFREVMAKASETTGHDWSGVGRPGGGTGSPNEGEPESSKGASHRAKVTLAGLGSVVLAAILATVLMAEADAPERVGPVRISPTGSTVNGKPEAEEKAAVKRLTGKKSRGGPRKIEARAEIATASAESDPGTAAPDDPAKPVGDFTPDKDRKSKPGPSRPPANQGPTPQPKPSTPEPEPEPKPEPTTPDPPVNPDPPDPPAPPDPPDPGVQLPGVPPSQGIPRSPNSN